MFQSVKKAIELSLMLPTMKHLGYKTDTYKFDTIITNETEFKEVIDELKSKYKTEPCQHKNLKVEFLGGGFVHTCKDCGEDVYVPRKNQSQEDIEDDNENKYWRKGWNKGYGPQSEEEYRSGKWTTSRWKR